jgi:nucleoside-diphosphate-sugar epimerase
MKREMKLVFVTGASGFLGNALSRTLLALGVSVRALVRSPEQGEPLRQLGAEIVLGDIRDPSIRTAVDDVDTVFHCAAAVGPPSLRRETFHSVNVAGTQNLIEAFKKSRHLQRFVHTSTAAVVGETDPRNPADEDAACHPVDTYGETKLLAEGIVVDSVRAGLPAVIARPMWIYGASSPITAHLFRRIAARKLPMVGPARNTMQPVAVEEAVSGILLCGRVEGIEGRTYNLAGPEILTIRSMCEIIAEVMGTTLPKLRVPISAGLPLAIVAESVFSLFGVAPLLSRKKLEFFRINNSYSIARARRDLNWNPQITFREGARQVATELAAPSSNRN